MKRMEDYAEMAFNCLISEYDGTSGFDKETAETVKNEVLLFIHNHPKIIRCRDCRNYYKGHCQCEDTIYWNRDPEWFCADGVKKDDR